MSSQSTTDLVKFFLAAHNKNNAEIGQFLRRILDLGIPFKASKLVSADGIQPEVVSLRTACPSRAQRPTSSSKPLRKLLLGVWGSPHFLGFPDAGNNAAGLAASVLAPLLNQNMANQNVCSPEATFTEMEVVHWMCAALGYPVPITYRAAGGFLTPGGCLSNTVALVAARETRLFPGSGLTGLPVLSSTIRVLVPNRSVVRVPVAHEYRMDPHALERIIGDEQAQGNSVLAWAANGIRFHVDALDGQLAFSELHRNKLRGIENADSIALDPHEVLFGPNSCPFVLFKDLRARVATAANSDLILTTQWSLGRITPLHRKAFDVLKLWATIKFFGRASADERLELTHAIQSEINKRPYLSSSFIKIPEPAQRYCIRHGTRLSDADLQKLNKLNRDIKEAIRQDGECTASP
ncbi:hypothetical protein PHLGIDRAFT_114370 [Phlebiopsis gigantea 11061_1 CR5-6]|uniref:Uncharacterized protein n=1 Tax=Phlebiopsis gigantea (strain 11061_1 CR5-6) TaxID=745531 RepID=A0A0C3P138_PHLG1|nr:hypothetical protein PHLGIDRAFT_114370 [Phlebiopsis gigantea 11061_1 CR5-6]